MHLGNPKSVLSWIAIMTPGGGPHAPREWVAIAFFGCVLPGVLILLGYTWLFPTQPLVRGYAKARRWIESALAFVFAGAGLRLIIYR